MDEVCTYHIEVRDQVDESDFNAASPLQIIVVQVGPAATQFTICTDQAGLVGMIRYLHRHGFVLQSAYRDR